MVVRHHAIDFASGALVFPGRTGRGSRLRPSPLNCSIGPSRSDRRTATLAFRIAAIRETFEECGVLLARPRGGSAA